MRGQQLVFPEVQEELDRRDHDARLQRAMEYVRYCVNIGVRLEPLNPDVLRYADREFWEGLTLETDRSVILLHRGFDRRDKYAGSKPEERLEILTLAGVEVEAIPQKLLDEFAGRLWYGSAWQLKKALLFHGGRRYSLGVGKFNDTDFVDDTPPVPA